MAVITRRFATGFSELKPSQKAIQMSDVLLTDLRRQLTGKDKNPERASVDTDEHCSSVRLSQTDLEHFAELIAARVCAWIERRTGTPHQKSEAGHTLE